MDSCKIFSLVGGMKRIDVSENNAKNTLPVGTILRLDGYSYPKYCIVANLGINERFTGYGARYQTVDLEKKTFSFHDAYSMDFDDGVNRGIHMYITNKTLSADEVIALHQAATANEKQDKENKEKAKAEADQLDALGRELFARFIPVDAKALIVAIHEIDNCEIQTDYFNTTTREKVILGYSTHKRDIFSEMRKLADRIPETAHLKTPPDTDENKQTLTEENKSWWHPADEHREKYSMGAGYYLKAAHRYSTGWKIEKAVKYGEDWGREWYISMAKRCIFNKAA